MSALGNDDVGAGGGRDVIGLPPARWEMGFSRHVIGFCSLGEFFPPPFWKEGRCALFAGASLAAASEERSGGMLATMAVPRWRSPQRRWQFLATSL